MSFWDDPANNPPESWPGQSGGTVTGRITKMGPKLSRYGNVRLVVELDGDGRERWCGIGLWRALRDARAEPGDMVVVTRLDDGTGGTRWTVERRATEMPRAGAQTAVHATTGPQW